MGYFGNDYDDNTEEFLVGCYLSGLFDTEEPQNDYVAEESLLSKYLTNWWIKTSNENKAQKKVASSIIEKLFFRAQMLTYYLDIFLIANFFTIGWLLLSPIKYLAATSVCAPFAFLICGCLMKLSIELHYNFSNKTKLRMKVYEEKLGIAKNEKIKNKKSKCLGILLLVLMLIAFVTECILVVASVIIYIVHIIGPYLLGLATLAENLAFISLIVIVCSLIVCAGFLVITVIYSILKNIYFSIKLSSLKQSQKITCIKNS